VVRRQFIRFLIVGVSNTAISLVVYRVLLALGVWYVVSAPIAWAAGVVNGYVFNSRWTFAAPDTGRARLLYALFGAIGAGVAAVLVLAFVRGAGLGKFEAYLAAAPLVTVSTFLANRYWTFSDRG
jgi:putative flippase GtrA